VALGFWAEPFVNWRASSDSGMIKAPVEIKIMKIAGCHGNHDENHGQQQA
jgi:hypothetical protein